MADFASIYRSLQEKNYAPIYFLEGEEAYFIDVITSWAETNILDDAQKGFNQYILYGKDIDMGQLLNTARKYPMFGDKQLVVIKEAQEMKSWKRAEDLSLLAAYLERPQASTILFIAHKYKKLDKRSKLGKLLEKSTVYLDSKKIYDNQIPQWIENLVKEEKLKITQRATLLLTEHIGNNLQRLSNEIKKLKINIGENEIIDERAVEKYVGISKEYNVFELQNALGQRNLAKSVKISKFFAADPSGNPLIPIITNLYNFFSRLLILHVHKAYEKNAIAQTLSINPFFATEYLIAVRNFSYQEIVHILVQIHVADLKSKGINFSTHKNAHDEILLELIAQILARNTK